MTKLVKFWRSRDISTTIKSKVYHACIRSSLLYCCETWPLKTSDIKKLDSFEIRCARSILRPSRLIKSSDIRGILKLDSSVSMTIQKRRLKCLGHVFRHDPTTLSNSALEFVNLPDWKRPRVGMKWTWRHLLNADLSSILEPVKTNKEAWDAFWLSIASDAARNSGTQSFLTCKRWAMGSDCLICPNWNWLLIRTML